MLGLLSLGVCIACISCLCCICTATVVAAPALIDLRTGLLLCGQKQCNETRRKSDEIISSDAKKNVSRHNEVTCEEIEHETCPCTLTYVLDPILQSRNSSQACTIDPRKRIFCKCPSFLDLVGDLPKSTGKVLQRS